jgi:hypothetical protein
MAPTSLKVHLPCFTAWRELKEFYVRWNLPRLNYQRMQEERRERYRNFLQRNAHHLGSNTLPEDLNGHLFVDFVSEGRARLLQSRPRLLWRSLSFGVILCSGYAQVS